MAEADIVRHDQGGVNARILAKENKADFRRIEAASVKMKATFRSAEGKRMFVRYFNTLQLSAHFISVIARTRVDHADVARVEAVMQEQMDKVGAALDKAIDGAEALFSAHGIAAPATYDTLPLEVEVGVLSSFGLRYLELLQKLDQAMPMLQTLEIFRIITTQVVDIERAGLKRKVRDVANGARSLATRMRRVMNTFDERRSLTLSDRAGTVASGEMGAAEEPDGGLSPHESNGDARGDATSTVDVVELATPSASPALSATPT
ncbi:MAG: DUF1845 family protein [Rubrivivax sp.]|nr:DUF1845 family protein [Burkholderiales bacterium]MCW5632044.1 DUF1845 family protein [Rubrivivax sp.]